MQTIATYTQVAIARTRIKIKNLKASRDRSFTATKSKETRKDLACTREH